MYSYSPLPFGGEQLYYRHSSLYRLNPVLTINSISVSPTFRYRGEDADTSSWPAWGYGQDLTATGAAGLTADQSVPVRDPDNKSVLFEENNVYRTGDNSFGDITTEDYVVEAVLRFDDTAEQCRLVSKRTGSVGWEIFYNGSDRVTAHLDDGPNLVGAFTDTDITDDTWFHLMFFADRSGLASWYINGSLSGDPKDISSVGDMTVSGELTIGGWPDSLTRTWDGNIAYIAMWKNASWLDTHLQGTLASQRFNAIGLAA